MKWCSISFNWNVSWWIKGVQYFYTMHTWVERPSLILGYRTLRTCGFKIWANQTNDLKFGTRCLIVLARRSALWRIGQGLVGSESGQCDWVGHGAGGLVSQWGNTIKLAWWRTATTMIAHCNNLGYNIPTTNESLYVSYCGRTASDIREYIRRVEMFSEILLLLYTGLCHY